MIWSGDDPLVIAARKMDEVFKLGQSLSLAPRAKRISTLESCLKCLSWLRHYNHKKDPFISEMLDELEQRLTELATNDSDFTESDRCTICAQKLQKTGIGQFCDSCLDKFLGAYNWLESDSRGFGTCKVGAQFRQV